MTEQDNIIYDISKIDKDQREKMNAKIAESIRTEFPEIE